jgi:hypothetical protein
MKLNKKILTIFISLLTPLSASATLISTDLAITASTHLGAGIDIDSSTTNTGSFSVGVNTGNVINLAVTGNNTSNVNITDTDETLRFDTDINSTSLDGNTYAYEFGMQLDNNHITDTFTVNFNFIFSNMVSAFSQGYSRSNISLFDNNGEFFFSDIMSDADYGNSFNGISDPQGTLGGTLNDNGTFYFSYTLLAGESVNFDGFVENFFGFTDGINGVQQNSDATLSISDVRQFQVGPPPVGVPEPSSLILFLTVLILYVRTQSKGLNHENNK